jgi:polysaccharide biosynthesis transport protein
MRTISNEPSANGLFELISGRASFRDVITKDRLSALNLIVAGRTGVDRLVLLSSPDLAVIFAALAKSYDHVVVDAGLLGGAEMAAIGDVAPHAMLLTANPTDGTTVAARDRLLAAGFDDVTVLIGSRSASAFKAVAA